MDIPAFKYADNFVRLPVATIGAYMMDNGACCEGILPIIKPFEHSMLAILITNVYMCPLLYSLLPAAIKFVSCISSTDKLPFISLSVLDSGIDIIG